MSDNDTLDEGQEAAFQVYRDRVLEEASELPGEAQIFDEFAKKGTLNPVIREMAQDLMVRLYVAQATSAAGIRYRTEEMAEHAVLSAVLLQMECYRTGEEIAQKAHDNVPHEDLQDGDEADDQELVP